MRKSEAVSHWHLVCRIVCDLNFRKVLHEPRIDLQLLNSFTISDLDATMSLEKHMDPLAIASHEINFKFPMDDRVCTIDEMILPPPQPPAQCTTFLAHWILIGWPNSDILLSLSIKNTRLCVIKRPAPTGIQLFRFVSTGFFCVRYFCGGRDNAPNSDFD